MTKYLDGVEYKLALEQLKQVWEDLHHATGIFPSDTNLICTLTALNTANTFSEWAEIVDGSANALSTVFASASGHIVSVILESTSEDDEIYMLELSYGADKTIISRWRFAGSTLFHNPLHQIRVRGVIIPAGETVYYRLKTASAVADTALVHFRYFLHS